MTVLHDDENRRRSPRRMRLPAVREDPVIWALVAIVVLGAAARLYFLVVYHPGLIGWSDTYTYLSTARGPLFQAQWTTAGYPIFLRVLHIIWPRLILATIVQHVLGVLGGVLLFDAVRRAGLPRAIGLVPAAVVIISGFEIVLEHAILTDASFAFLVIIGLWCTVGAWSGRWWWAFAAGVCLGLGADDREIGLLVLPVAACGVCLAPRKALASGCESVRPRLRAAARVLRVDRVLAAHPIASWRGGAVAALLCGALLPILPFLYAHEQAVGNFDFTTSGAVDFYGRVAPWVDCSKFTPPAGTAELCPSQPVSERTGFGSWVFGADSPMVKAYGGTGITPAQNAKVEAFALAAIEAQPLTYLGRVARDVVRLVDPSFTSSPNPAIGNAGGDSGATPDALAMFSPSSAAVDNSVVVTYYQASQLHAGDASLIVDWTRLTEFQGPVMLLAILLALIAPILATGSSRRFALICLAAAAVLLIGPIATDVYSYRLEVPGFGPLAAAAAVGAYEIWRRARLIASHRRPIGLRRT
jgi:hypothetical protein